ncbi:hypothetical protein Ngar_c29520 [Candidatus Nitrososphaera gargensis Ga9.2]|uniref:Uncharacterized protein n=1 Tax=Nitrososphaera gargensis (strain Ga9.2) TaxID=1237085 RepID=K0IIT3_NITGG|nr:winged helix-turn-helix domain-containing protein [Candidatus Nitrososphaera gargensis]AFU59870.1 hypothetical protein Ngar_c29520 [Candidatus Nitrososphaera gargensis Ga9.2]
MEIIDKDSANARSAHADTDRPPPDAQSMKLYHGNIDWDVAKRLLHMIYLHGPIKKTRLAMKTAVNSSTCTRYVTWLIEIGWVATNNFDEFSLTEAGLAIYKRIKWQDYV